MRQVDGLLIHMIPLRPKASIATLAFAAALFLPSLAFASQIYAQPDFSTAGALTNVHTHNCASIGVDCVLTWTATTSGNYLGTEGVWIYGSATQPTQNVLIYKNGSLISSGFITMPSSPDWANTVHTGAGFSYTAGDVITVGFDLNVGNIQLYGTTSPSVDGGTCTSGSAYCGSVGTPAIALGGTSAPTPPVPDTSTHIVDFTPEEGTTTSNPVLFSLHAYINPADIGGQFQIAFTLHNIDQNVVLLSALSPNDIYFLENVVATTSGDFYYSTTTTIADGNYRINAILQKNVLWGWLKDPFSSVNENLSHQFVVGAPTLIGSLTQNGFNELNAHLASSTATSSIALVEGSCNPLSGFSMTGCLTGLFVPDAQALNTTITGFQQGVLQRVPWGYFTRIYAILSSTSTASLPSYTVNVALNNASDTTTLTFNPADMIAGAGSLLASTTDPYDHKNLRDIAEPVVQLVIALGVVLTIFADLTGSHRHQSAESIRAPRRA